eukprot:TRINITY_DN677_c0_g2_i1.p1 TRINITY_DN677_c0_g2~~TRINITY_DN677_c0_g2_i1.p1  ORF type:complete len:320 (-),score=78.47 TRINITY_DN677_c0_g2_i1:138-1097(-)
MERNIATARVPSILTLLDDETANIEFFKFVQNSHSVCNVHFYQAVQKYKKLEEDALLPAALDIYRRFIALDSAEQVHVDCHVLRDIELGLRERSVRRDLFDEAHADVANVIAHDSMRRFAATPRAPPPALPPPADVPRPSAAGAANAANSRPSLASWVRSVIGGWSFWTRHRKPPTAAAVVRTPRVRPARTAVVAPLPALTARASVNNNPNNLVVTSSNNHTNNRSLASSGSSVQPSSSRSQAHPAPQRSASTPNPLPSLVDASRLPPRLSASASMTTARMTPLDTAQPANTAASSPPAVRRFIDRSDRSEGVLYRSVT